MPPDVPESLWRSGKFPILKVRLSLTQRTLLRSKRRSLSAHHEAKPPKALIAIRATCLTKDQTPQFGVIQSNRYELGSLPQSFVKQDTRGNRNIERLNFPQHRNPHQHIAVLTHQAMKSGALSTQDHS